MTVSVFFLKADATKDEGMNMVAKHYKVKQDWNNYENSIKIHHTRPEKYFNLLMIVKTKRDINNVCVSFIEGLLRHSAILFCLMCSSFGYVDNEVKQGSLKMRDFKNAKIPHFKAANREPVDHLEDILDDKYPAEMLTKCFQVQAFYPTQVSTEVNHLMNTLHMHSEWISNNRKLSAEKMLLYTYRIKRHFEIFTKALKG
jgi:hypothetical protein